MIQNLLSKHQKKKIRREYYMRLFSIASLMLCGVLFAGVVALLPSYVDVVGDLKTAQKELEQRQSSAESSKELNAEVKETAVMLAVHEEELKKENVTDIIRATLDTRPEGISIVGYTYDRSARNISLEGIAKTRNLVAPYAKQLEDSEWFTSAPVPISDLAKNTNLNFRLQVTINGEE
jgi:hypothetical protein